jgi:hydroxymethylbilane synthase
MAARIAAYLDPPAWLPAAGQGAIAIQVRADDAPLRALFATLDHAPTTLAVAAERAFLGALEGGCQVPIGALAVRVDAGLVLHGMVASMGGEQVIRGSMAVAPADPARTGRELAAELLGQGASAILAALRGVALVPAPQPE